MAKKIKDETVEEVKPKKKSEKINQQEKEVKELKDELEKTNKKFKTSFVTFDDSPLSNLEFISSGDKSLDKILSGLDEGGGWVRGRFVELYGPEGSGKTYLLSRLYAYCQQNGLKAAHYDAEGTYSKDFAKLHGVDTTKLAYSAEDKAEKIFEEIEKLCEENVYDVIGIDSLASLVPEMMMERDMGAQSYSLLAAAISRCIPRLSSAVKKSKTVVILINQVRDDVSASKYSHGPNEKTPGGRAVKFYASIRLEVRKGSAKKDERPELFDANDKAIGHILKIKCTKNKVAPPFGACEIDLMYQTNRVIINIIKQAIESDIIVRFRNKNGELYGRRLEFNGNTYTPLAKGDYEGVLLWLKECDAICDLLVKTGYDDFDEFVESGDLTIEEVDKYLQKEENPEQEIPEEITEF